MPSTLYSSPLSLASAASDPQSSNSSDAQSSLTPVPCPLSSSDSVSSHSVNDCDTTYTPVSPSPIVSPLCSQNTEDSGTHTSFQPGLLSPIANPLVAVGLVPPDLADILATPSEDAAVLKKRTKHITGARELT